MPKTRLTVHYACDGVLENEDALNVREMTPHGDDRDHGDDCDHDVGVAFL